jgi:hypothetical protein
MHISKSDPRLLVVYLASFIFFFIGVYKASHYSPDFVPVYTGARCLVKGCNPYDTTQLQQQYFQRGGLARQLLPWRQEIPVYPPSTLVVFAPLTVLNFPAARLLWACFNASLYIFTVLLLLYECPRAYRWLVILIGSLFLLTSYSPLIAAGQPATFAICLLIIGIICFLHDRYLALAALLFMVSVAAKPQLGGFIVAYFLLKRIHWRHAAAALAGALILLLLGVMMLQHHRGSADWLPALRANLVTIAQPGAVDDPRPSHKDAIGFANLQAVTSIFSANEKTFNAAAYLIFLALLVAWAWAAFQTDRRAAVQYVALAGLAVISLLPVYHRIYDAKLLLLTIPAIPLIYQRHRIAGAAIAALTLLETVSEPLQHQVVVLFQHHLSWQPVLNSGIAFAIIMREENIELLLLCVLYIFAVWTMRSAQLVRLPHSLRGAAELQ